MKIGLLGGSFNPAHLGHRDISLYALRKLGLDQIWWMISPCNPMKNMNDMMPLDKRIAYANKIKGHPKIIVQNYEENSSSLFSYHTIKRLKKEFNHKFIWIMGADNLYNFHKWYRWQDIAKEINLLILDRDNYFYKAKSSIFASKYSDFQIPQQHASLLLIKNPPYWSYINIRRNDSSSTNIRKSNDYT